MSLHINMLAYELAVKLQAEQPRCDLPINFLPKLGLVQATDLIPVYANGQTYAAPAALLASVPPFPTGIYNVVTYGMLPSNTGAENQLALQATIDACVEDGGGIVLIPDGTYEITGGINIDISIRIGDGGVTITGESVFGAVLIQQSSVNFFTIANYGGQVGMQNMSIRYASNTLTGKAIYVNSSYLPTTGTGRPGVALRFNSVQVVNAQVAFYFFDSQNVTLSQCAIISSGTTHVAGYWIDGGSYGSAGATAINLEQCDYNGDGANGVGLLLGVCEDVQCFNASFRNANYGCEVGSALVVNNPDRVGLAPPSTYAINYPLLTQQILLVGCFFEENNTHGLYVHPPGPPNPTTTPGSWAVTDWRMTACHTGGNGKQNASGGNGIYFAGDPATSSSGTISSVQLSNIGSTLNGNQIKGYPGSGMVIESGNDFVITGGFYGGNATNGIYFDANNYAISQAQVTGVRAAGHYGGEQNNPQNYGIRAAGAPQAIIITACNVDGNATNNIYPGNSQIGAGVWGPGCTITNNHGFNPQGFITNTVAPSFPATGVFQQNNFLYPVQVFTTGGCITRVAVQTTAYVSTGSSLVALQTVYGGDAGGINLGVFNLQPTDQIRFVYTGSPTWKWQGQ